jgi:hypothetical protein
MKQCNKDREAMRDALEKIAKATLPNKFVMVRSEIHSIATTALSTPAPEQKEGTLSDWISVEDRLPEVPPPYYDKEWGGKVEPLSTRVIVWDGEDVYEEHYHKSFGNTEGHFSSNEDNSITHWMPLPTPPSSEKNPETIG